MRSYSENSIAYIITPIDFHKTVCLVSFLIQIYIYFYKIYFNLHRDEEVFALKLEQIIEKASMLHCVLVNQVTNEHLSEMEKMTNLLNTSNCYRQVLKEHLKYMYNQLKYLTAVELQKQDTQLCKQIVRFTNNNNFTHHQ